MSTALESKLVRRDWCTARLLESPYDAGLYLKRAGCYEELNYPDLAASDAYKALILNDELQDDSGEYHEKAVEAVVRSDFELATAKGTGLADLRLGQNTDISASQDEPATDNVSAEKRRSWLTAVAEEQSGQAYETLARCLIDCGDLKSAWEFADRGSKALPSNINLRNIRARASEIYIQQQLQSEPSWDPQPLRPQIDLPQNGLVRREIYTWNSLEPERFSPSALSFLNAEIAQVAPKLEICSVELPLLDMMTTAQSPNGGNHERPEPVMLKQLGLFATCDIFPGEQILLEPSILTANNRLHDPLCDACSSPLPKPTLYSPLPSCPSCDDAVFCSTSCLKRAQTFYHPAVCGLSDFDISTRDPSPTAATNSLYLLLLARTIAMAETQDIHPLSLREIKYLWGEFNPPPPHLFPSPNSLPFSFEMNIATPIHLLENLNLDIFAPDTVDRYDTWVINTLMAKFRGVASAKMNPRTGMPEVCAVHWRWCLANHSCAPNVRWEWPATQMAERDAAVKASGQEQEEVGGGCMAFFARGGEDVVQWGSQERGEKLGGIKKGEEVMSHYCDVELPVEARREWAAGALGGECVCERCVWEADAKSIAAAVAGDDGGGEDN